MGGRHAIAHFFCPRAGPGFTRRSRHGKPNGAAFTRIRAIATQLASPDTTDAPGDEAALVALVGRMRFGDTAALGQLYDLALPRVYGLAMRVLRQPQDAEEVVSDVFLQAWEQAAGFCPERGAVMAWLLTLTWSRAVDKQRRGRRQRLEQPLHPDGLDESYTPGEANPADVLDRLGNTQAVQHAFRALSPAQRSVIELTYLEDLSQPEIAQRTGLPLGTVKSHARRGLAAMRAALMADGESA
ncbi:sigma-70 family RNA polymerase sigma factor [Arenimonas sp.]|uniref:sigma-70 family RNA polymerase sigma factor n=1 Tax=Arenimonas sp. TaxID=1872635 RepID=UPI002E378D4B|nr:sigma-70 family RNA polymerase sigma factor [Arenimonas sp.]HEX4854629.1 sigma-70 family RNA polymerase sigma factor [Arenimonas sp.]